MALIQCKECGADVSSEAVKCPSCGIVLQKLKRSFMGKLFKWAFILFNILMVVWLFSYWGSAGDMINNADSEVYKSGAAIGATIGTGMIATFWVLGDIILGLFVLFTRPKY